MSESSIKGSYLREDTGKMISPLVHLKTYMYIKSYPQLDNCLPNKIVYQNML